MFFIFFLTYGQCLFRTVLAFFSFVLNSVVSISATDCLERLVSKMTYNALMWDVKSYSLTYLSGYLKFT